MKQEQINKLEQLSSIVKEYNDKKQLLDKGKILSNGYYRDYFYANNTTKNKPIFNFGLLIALFCLFGVPVLCTLNNMNFATIIFLILFICGSIILIISYIKNIYHWIKVNSKYNDEVKQAKVIVFNLLKQMQEYKSLMLGVDVLEVDNLLSILKHDKVNSIQEAVKIYTNQKNSINQQDKIVSDLTSIILNQQKIEIEHTNLENAKIEHNQQYIKCKYCGLLNIDNCLKCQNCGAMLDNTK